MQRSSVDGSYGDAVFIGIDAVVHTFDRDDAAVDREMQFTVKPLVLGNNIQNAVAFFSARNVHRHFGIKRAVIFMQFFRGAFFIDPCDIRAGYCVCAVVR